MARTIDEIKQSITDRLVAKFSLSTSAAAEWRMWVHCVAYAIYAFEVILDAFQKEMDNKADTIVPGSLTWYTQMCYRYQYGHELLFNRDTALLYYEKEDAQAQIIKIASVKESDRLLLFKVATKNAEGVIVPLSEIQFLNFCNYLDAVKFAGSKTQVISTESDLIRYHVKVWYNPATPTTVLHENIKMSLDSFRTEQWFGGMVYTSGFLDAIKRVNGVVTAKLLSFERKGGDKVEFVPIDVRADLYAGYFNYAEEGCNIELININDLE